MISKIQKHWTNIGATAKISSFRPADGVGEYHVILTIEARGETFCGQVNRLLEAERALASIPELINAQTVMKRYFLSDATNQVPVMQSMPEHASAKSGGTSYIQQPPLDGSKIALWIYMIEGVEVKEENGMTIVEHNGYRHMWQMNMCDNNGDSAQQTRTLLEKYEQTLAQYDATIADNCIRTWFFVRDVDTQYAGLVRARRENFIQQGLTPQTHYIASTGIGGNPADPKALIQLGAYALTGLQPEQTQYLYALSHLNRTIEYGVTFERGTLIKYGDRNHAYISGTASINNKGEVMHIGDIIRQTERMWENVEKLLEEGSMTTNDIMQIIVYLRDNADYDIVSHMFQQKFPDTPYVITLAPVCRPTWLIEMECVAISSSKCPTMQKF